MKIKKYKILAMAVITMCFTACDSYLDVEPKGTADENKMFSDFEGFRDAMYGAYSSISKNDLYGNNLSYGFIDELAQLYFNDAEAGIDGGNVLLKKTISYEYKDQMLRPIINSIWGQSYKSISYVNNIIKHIEKVNMESNPHYKLIKGEAYAFRAFMHFDLLRKFSENMTVAPDSRGVPYSTEFDLELPELGDVEKTYDNILDDIKVAEDILESDTIMDQANPVSSFGTERTLHLNKYAVWALKSRVYLWKGDLTNAATYAEKVINSKRFTLYDKVELKKNVRYPSKQETIWAVFNDKQYEPVYNKFVWEDANNKSLQYVRSDVEDIYEVSSFDDENSDSRFSAYFTSGAHGKLFTRLLEKPTVDAKTGKIERDSINGFTMIRLPEMYYIAAEALYDTNLDKSKKYFNDLRNSRGLSDISDDRIDTKEKFINELFLDKKKEFWGEGQIFLEYKRLNKDIEDKEGNIHTASNAIFVFPWPDNEIEFGNTFKN